jgi:hypothetical protein
MCHFFCECPNPRPAPSALFHLVDFHERLYESHAIGGHTQNGTWRIRELYFKYLFLWRWVSWCSDRDMSWITGYRILIPSGGKESLSSPKCPDEFRGPPMHPFNGCQGLFLGRGRGKLAEVSS